MNPLALEFRLLFWAILGVIVPFGFLLYFFPSSTESYWAWVIHHPRSSTLIGAGYVGAIAYYLLTLKENDWRQTRNGMGGLITFCIVLLIATMLHWEHFRPYHITTLVWLMFYYVGPFLVPIVYRLQSARPANTSPKTETPIGQGWRAWLGMRGFFYLSLALLWCVSAATVSEAWPWPIEPLEVRVFMGQVAIIGWNAIVAIRERQPWRNFRLGLLLCGAIGFTQLVGLALGSGPADWSVGIGIFLPVMFAEWLLTPLVLYLVYERSFHKT